MSVVIHPTTDTMIAGAPRQCRCSAMTTSPISSVNAPATQGHTKFARNSVSSVRISEVRAIAVTVTITRKGPITRANKRVLGGVGGEVLMAVPLSGDFLAIVGDWLVPIRLSHRFTAAGNRGERPNGRTS